MLVYLFKLDSFYNGYQNFRFLYQQSYSYVTMRLLVLFYLLSPFSVGSIKYYVSSQNINIHMFLGVIVVNSNDVD